MDGQSMLAAVKLQSINQLFMRDEDRLYLFNLASCKYIAYSCSFFNDLKQVCFFKENCLKRNENVPFSSHCFIIIPIQRVGNSFQFQILRDIDCCLQVYCHL